MTSESPKLSAQCAHCGALTTRGRFCIHCGKEATVRDAGAAISGERNAHTANDESKCDTLPVQSLDGSLWAAAGAGIGAIDPRLGATLAGRYRIDSVLGRGGYGAVYKGLHLSIGEPVAIKFLHAEHAGDPDLRARFRREAVALARLRHPGIVSVHDFGEEGGALFLVMEFVPGASLGKLVLVGGRTLPVPRLAAIFDQLLQVLEAAHAAGIVHRDMKFENVMVLASADRAEHIKVLDFGIALVDDQAGAERLTATGKVQGTPLYMSPEQCRGRDVGPPTDVYAVGAMLYEMLAGEAPFRGASIADLMVKHMFIDPPPMAERGIRQHVAPALEAIVRAALAKKPEDRPTAPEMRDLLSSALAGTDPVSRALRSQEQRIATLGVSRDERGLPVAQGNKGPTVQDPAPAPAADAPRVLLWQLDEARADALTAAMGVHGLAAIGWRSATPPQAEVEGVKLGVIVIAGAEAAERTRALRAAPTTKTLPVLVIDLAQADDTAVMIRAGASDVTLALAGDEAICKKLKRLIQRGR